MRHTVNFSAGPAVLPEEVLAQRVIADTPASSSTPTIPQNGVMIKRKNKSHIKLKPKTFRRENTFFFCLLSCSN